MFASAGALFAQSPYIDPALRALSQTNTPANVADAYGVAMRRRTAVEIPRIGIIARVRSDAAVGVITGNGGTIGSRIGDLLTAEVPLAALNAIMQSPAFAMVEASRTIAVSHDSSMKAIRANLVRQQVGGTWTGTAGQGVIVAVYDTGLDFLHDDFIDSNGQTRVLALWDQTGATGTPPAGFGYGRLCTRADIQQSINFINNLAACPQVDNNGHGTHVAGTAAGDGSAVGNGNGVPFTYAGVAPLADLIIVKGGNGFFSESNIIDGLTWLEQQARALNRPMAVNISIGGQVGAHDGSRLYEQAIDRLSRPGFVVVVAATNDGVNANDKLPDGAEPARNPLLIHGSGLPATTRDHTFEIINYTPLPGACNDFVNFSLWYDGDDRYDITLMRPDGRLITATFGQLVEVDEPIGNVRIDNAQSRTANPINRSYEADIRVNDCGPSGATPQSGFWTLRITKVSAPSQRPYHFWMYAQALGGGSLARGRTNFDNRFIVGSPGNARMAITVGAFTTRNCWPSPAKPEGPVCFQTIEQIGDIARFSSPGPTRDGRMKPEVTAPGIAIASALSRFSAPAANRILPDNAHVINQGTSMAAPHVTGAIALMMQHRPSLDADGVRDIFSRTADRDVFTSRVYGFSPDARSTDWWGYGKLNVCAAVGAVGINTSGTSGPVVITPAADTLPVNATTRFFSCSPTAGSIMFATTDASVATVDANGVVRAVRAGSTLIIATSGAFADTAIVVVTAPARLAINSRSAAPGEVTRGARGTVLPLLSTVLRADGHEPVQVRTLGFRVNGNDPNANLVLISDINRNGRFDVGERIIERTPVALTGTAVDVDVTIDSLTVAQRDSLHLIVAVELSGRAPNGAVFQAELLPQRSRTLGVRSAAIDQLGAITSVASALASSTVLAEGTTFSLSENPIRSGRVVFNFSERPKLAAVYTLSGRRVIDLLPRLTTGSSVDWNLHNDAGERVATGVYFVVFDVAGRIVREKIFVLGGAQ